MCLQCTKSENDRINMKKQILKPVQIVHVGYEFRWN